MSKLKFSIFVLAIALSVLFLFAGNALQTDAPGVRLRAAIEKEEVEGDLQAAIEQYKEIVADNGENRPVAARALLRLAGCYEKLGQEQAQETYKQLIRDYPDQTDEVILAKQKLGELVKASKEQASRPVFRKINIPGRINYGAQLSPDGSRLAFEVGADIWVVNIHGNVAPDIAGEPLKLTHEGNAIWAGLYWSGDSQWIAFNEDKIPCRNIFVSPASGGALQKVPRIGPIMGSDPWWLGLSQDGSRIAYSTGPEDGEVLRVASVRTGETLMRFGKRGATEPRFSPADKYIAYMAQVNDSVLELRIVRLVDGRDTRLAEIHGHSCCPAWSPDGSMIALFVFREEQPSKNEVWIIPVPESGKAGGKPTRISLPRGGSLAGWTSDNKIGLLSRSPFHSPIYTVPLEGGRATQVTADEEGLGFFLPQWSPDGKKIYFRYGSDTGVVSASGGKVSIISRSGKKITETLPGGGNHISPDGKQIAFSGYQEGVDLGARLWIMPVTGGEPSQLQTNPDLMAWQPRWSPDGKWIAFESERAVPGDRKLDENIFIVSSEGGEARQLTHHADCFCELEAWSPDGKSIAYACTDRKIRIIPAEGGNPRIVVKADGLESHSGSLCWTPNGQRILYTAKGQIWTVPVSGGEPDAIRTDMDGKILQFTLSPDGEIIAFNAPYGNEPELWLMEDFLPLVKDR